MSDEEARDTGPGWGGIEAIEAAIEAVVPGGDLITHLMDHIPGVQLKKARSFCEQLLKLVDRDPEFVKRRVLEDPGFGRLVWDAARGSAQTELDSKILAFARIAAEAVVDDARLEEARMIVSSLAPLESIHISVLRMLADEEQAQGELPPIYERLDLSVVNYEVVTLKLRSVFLSSSSEIAAGNHSPPRISDFGKLVLGYLAEHLKDAET